MEIQFHNRSFHLISYHHLYLFSLSSTSQTLLSILTSLSASLQPTESLIRNSKIGQTVGKLRTHSDKRVSDKAKAIVKGWKAEMAKNDNGANGDDKKKNGNGNGKKEKNGSTSMEGNGKGEWKELKGRVESVASCLEIWSLLTFSIDQDRPLKDTMRIFAIHYHFQSKLASYLEGKKLGGELDS